MSGGTSPRPGGARGGVGDIVRGMVLLGRGSEAGLGFFGNSADSFLSALAPHVAWQIVVAVLLMAQAPTGVNATKMLVSFCVILVPPVLSHVFAQRWQREGRWLRYATASLWCEWLSVFVLIVALLIAAIAMSGPPSGMVLMPVIAAPMLYDAWLRWFLARSGLGIGGWRALGLVLVTTVTLVALYGVAKLLPPHFDGLRDLMMAPPRGH